MRIKLKAGARLRGLKPEMMFALMVIREVYEELGSEELVITAGTDGVHRDGSLHNTGEGLDIRTRDFNPADRIEAHRLIQHRLRDQYDCVLEATHLHVEHDP